MQRKINPTFYSILLLAMAIIASPQYASADFFIMNDKASALDVQKHTKGKLKQSRHSRHTALTSKGLNYFDEGVIAGRGDRISFEIFKQQVLPDGVDAKCERCPKTITWASDGEPWQTIARRALAQHRMNYDKTRNWIRFIPVDANGKLLWFVNKGETAETTMKRWVGKANYEKLVWSIDKQFKMDVAHAYGTNDIREAVMLLLASIKKTTDEPVKAVFYKNKVIKIIYFGNE